MHATSFISEGIAACNIGGITVHSYAGIGLGTDPVEDLVKRIRKNRKTSGRWLRTRVLIIDECALYFHCSLYEPHADTVQCPWLTATCSTRSRVSAAFSATTPSLLVASRWAFKPSCSLLSDLNDLSQLVVTGDFFQLPPVNKNGKMTKFAFEAQLWDQCIKRRILLTKVFRQKDQSTCHHRHVLGIPGAYAYAYQRS